MEFAVGETLDSYDCADDATGDIVVGSALCGRVGREAVLI